MPNESGTTPLAELSRQPLEVSSTGHFLFNRKGQQMQPDFLQISLLARIADALEGNEGTPIARLSILLEDADDFRNVVDRLVRRYWPKTDLLAIVGWRIIGNSSALEVSLKYIEGEALFFLGQAWQEFTAQRAQLGSQGDE